MVGIVFIKWMVLVIILLAILNRSVNLCLEGTGCVEFILLWYFSIVLSSVAIHPVGNIISSYRSYKLRVHCRPTLY
jgi:hypothetical protein